MKREYTLLTLGILIAIIPWLGLTPSLRKIVFTILGVWVIFISYKYWKKKTETSQSSNQGNQTQVTFSEIKNDEPDQNQINYERRDQKPRI